MTAVCGICVSNAVEENCYILMPGCGHVFDRACITNSLGVEYTCPECKNNYLLPSPYRPFQLSDSNEFIEYKELHKHLMHSKQTIVQLQERLAKAHEDLSLEQRSRKKSNESLIILSQQLVALQERYNSVDSDEKSYLAVAVVSKDDGASINVDQGPYEIQAAPSPSTPVPIEAPKVSEEKTADKQPEDVRSRLLVYYNARIQELNASIPDARGDRKKSMKLHLGLILENRAMVEKLHTLVCLLSKISSNLLESKSNTERNAAKHRDIIAKLGDSVKKAKEIDDASIEEKQDKVKIYVDKIFELEEASRLAGISDIQALKTICQEHDELLPNGTQMYSFSTVSRRLKKVKTKHAKLVKMSADLKREKMQENLEHLLTKTKQYIKKIDSHATIIEQAEQMNQELEASLGE